ncbi:MAG: hypothetical protein V3U93_01760 [Alphaproteobacteria bacterium]
MDTATVQIPLDRPFRRGSAFPGARRAGVGGAVRRPATDGDLESVLLAAGQGVGIPTRGRPASERKGGLVCPALALSIAGQRPGVAERCSPAQA